MVPCASRLSGRPSTHPAKLVGVGPLPHIDNLGFSRLSVGPTPKMNPGKLAGIEPAQGTTALFQPLARDGFPGKLDSNFRGAGDHQPESNPRAPTRLQQVVGEKPNVSARALKPKHTEPSDGDEQHRPIPIRAYPVEGRHGELTNTSPRSPCQAFYRRAWSDIHGNPVHRGV